jgi:hypothetical protein
MAKISSARPCKFAVVGRLAGGGPKHVSCFRDTLLSDWGMFPRITNGKIYLPFGGELADGTMIDGMYELPSEDPSYEAIKAC